MQDLVSLALQRGAVHAKMANDRLSVAFPAFVCCRGRFHPYTEIVSLEATFSSLDAYMPDRVADTVSATHYPYCGQ